MTKMMESLSVQDLRTDVNGLTELIVYGERDICCCKKIKTWLSVHPLNNSVIHF